VISSSAAGCESSTSNAVIFGFTGINSSAEYNLSVYPNPFTGYMQIEYYVKTAGRVRIVIYNSLGNEVSVVEQGEKSQGSYKAIFDGSHLAAGIYHCKVFSNDGVKLVKVVKN